VISPDQIYSYFPPDIRAEPAFRKYMLKEHLQLMILDFLSTSVFVEKLTFIGGTCLRLVKGIDRFSEDLDFDCKDLSREEFMKMTDAVIGFLSRSGLSIEPRDKENPRLSAFRRNLYFPELLFGMGLSGYREERFLIKMEAQDQGCAYPKRMARIQGGGFVFPFPVPEDSVLYAMKLSAMLSRKKGRDFYDVLFLQSIGEPDYKVLQSLCGIDSRDTLRERVNRMLSSVDLRHKAMDFEHLLFHRESAGKVTRFGELFSV
jgi:hypothetical protein